MIIETIKNLALHQKLTKYPGFYSEIMKLDERISKEDALDIISLVNPKKTNIVKTSDPNILKTYLTINSYEFVYKQFIGYEDVPSIYNDRVPIKTTDEKIYVIKGNNIKLGEKLTELDGKIVISEPSFDKKEVCLIVKLDLRKNKKYTVLVYIP